MSVLLYTNWDTGALFLFVVLQYKDNKNILNFQIIFFCIFCRSRGDWTLMRPITLSTVYKTEGIYSYVMFIALSKNYITNITKIFCFSKFFRNFFIFLTAIAIWFQVADSIIWFHFFNYITNITTFCWISKYFIKK